VRIVEPLGYLEFLSQLGDAAAVLTDSGGIQEEPTFRPSVCPLLLLESARQHGAAR
jgi:UDP-N-acetylglucosamine 2-epimerase (non-hydrolysing)